MSAVVVFVDVTSGADVVWLRGCTDEIGAVTKNFVVTTGRADTESTVDGGMFSSGSNGILRRCLARRISPCFVFQAAAASRRPASLRSHHCSGCTSSARWVPRRTLTRSPRHHALPFGGGGRTRSKHVSPVQVNVLPSLGVCRDLASEGLPLHASSTIAISGHCSPANIGLVIRSTSMFLTLIGGGSLGTSSGEKRVVRGTRCTRTR